MSTHQLKYMRFRLAGYPASQAIYAARALLGWEGLESDGKVRLRALPEQESYFDVYGEPGGYTSIHGRRVSGKQEREEICEQIERNGCWFVVADYYNEELDRWEHADSIGMGIYANPLSPVENWYVPDLMSSAIDAYNAQAIAAAI